MKYCTGKIVEWLINHDAIESDDKELYEYALYSLWLLVTPLFLAIIVGLCFGRIKEGIVIVIPFMLLRKFSGGYHAKHLWISVNKNLPSKCAECEVKLFCGGGCRGVAIKSTGNLYGMSPECESSKNRLIEMIWTAAKEPDLFNYEIERNQKMDEVLENEIEKITEGNFKFTKIIQE